MDLRKNPEKGLTFWFLFFINIRLLFTRFNNFFSFSILLTIYKFPAKKMEIFFLGCLEGDQQNLFFSLTNSDQNFPAKNYIDYLSFDLFC